MVIWLTLGIVGTVGLFMFLELAEVYQVWWKSETSPREYMEMMDPISLVILIALGPITFVLVNVGLIMTLISLFMLWLTQE